MPRVPSHLTHFFHHPRKPNIATFFFLPSISKLTRLMIFWGFLNSLKSIPNSHPAMARPKYLLLRGIVGNFYVSDGTDDVGGYDWWDEIDSSDEWQRGVYYFLCSCYAFVSFVALVQLIRIQLRVPEYGWTTQKVFHLMNFIVNSLRAALFGMYKHVFSIRPKALEMFLLDLPGLLFFSTYTLLVLFWAEIYQQARSQPITKLRPTYYAINGIIYLGQFCIWLYAMAKPGHIAVEISGIFFSVVSFSAALGFLIYGGRLFVMLRRFPIESRGRQKKLYEVGFVTATCCSCFLIRCLVDSIASFNEKADVDVLEHPILNLVYYMLVEIVPSSLVLFVLRKLPPRRVSDQYHPIR